MFTMLTHVCYVPMGWVRKEQERIVEIGQRRAALREIGKLNGTLVLTVCNSPLEIQTEHELFLLPALELLLFS